MSDRDATLNALLALDWHLWADLGPTLTCIEAGVFADFLDAHGIPDAARLLIQSHAEADDAGDQHGGQA